MNQLNLQITTTVALYCTYTNENHVFSMVHKFQEEYDETKTPKIDLIKQSIIDTVDNFHFVKLFKKCFSQMYPMDHHKQNILNNVIGDYIDNEIDKDVDFDDIGNLQKINQLLKKQLNVLGYKMSDIVINTSVFE